MEQCGINTSGQGGECAGQHIWRRVHRPEEYVQDVIKFIAREINIPAPILLPFSPIATAILRGWEDAALEYTEYTIEPCGRRVLRTIFDIHNYSSSRIYNLIEEILRKIGVGKQMMLKAPDVDFMWLVLGGVLNDYAACACVSKKSTAALQDFRLANSDYLTITSWFEDSVEIANLKTGRIETMPLPPKDIECIINWAVDFQKKICGKKSCELQPTDPAAEQYRAWMAKYNEIKSSC